jgi:hypothetical protein
MIRHEGGDESKGRLLQDNCKVSMRCDEHGDALLTDTMIPEKGPQKTTHNEKDYVQSYVQSSRSCQYQKLGKTYSWGSQLATSGYSNEPAQ